MNLPLQWRTDDPACPNCGSRDGIETQTRIAGCRSRLQIECRDCGHVECWLIDHDQTFGGSAE